MCQANPIVYYIGYYHRDRAAVIAYNKLNYGHIPYTQNGANMKRRRKYAYKFSWCEKCYQTLQNLPSCIHVTRINKDICCF
jgi:hypothetical protein